MMALKKAKKSLLPKTFTLIEILIVVVIIGILMLAFYPKVMKAKERALLARSQKEFGIIYAAIEMYKQDFGGYPPDVSRNIPAGLEPYIQGYDTGRWPTAPYPNSVYDRDNWIISGENVVQLSIRFCPAGGPLNACSFPNETRASGFNINSAAYFCIKGTCRSHSSEAISYPGYCINCNR